MKMKRFWLLLLCVLAATALMQCAKEPTPESPTTQTGEDKATGEESKKDAGIASRTVLAVPIASRTVLAVPLSEEEMKYMKIFYYIPEGENQAPIPAVVTLNTMDQSFTLEHDPSSSYHIQGKYVQEEKDGKKVLNCRTEDGKYIYRFEVPDENSLVFMEEGSNPLNPHDDRLGVKMKDKMGFLSPEALEKKMQ